MLHTIILLPSWATDELSKAHWSAGDIGELSLLLITSGSSCFFVFLVCLGRASAPRVLCLWPGAMSTVSGDEYPGLDRIGVRV